MDPMEAFANTLLMLKNSGPSVETKRKARDALSSYQLEIVCHASTDDSESDSQHSSKRARTDKSNGSDSDTGSGLSSSAGGTDDDLGRPPLVPRRSKKRKVPRRKPSKAVEWRIADDKAVKHFQAHPDFAGWPSENDDDDPTRANDARNPHQDRYNDETTETTVDTTDPTATTATSTHDLVIHTATESTEDDSADEDEDNLWHEEQEQKAHEGVEGELRT
eukprot:gene31416-40450_t